MGYNKKYIAKFEVLILKLTEYLHGQLTFLDEQMVTAKQDNNETMQYLIDSKITEVKLILEALHKGIIDQLN